MTNLPPPEQLDELIDHIQARLAAAVSDYSAPWRTPMLATIGGSVTPTLRTVVIRAVDRAAGWVRIYTDRRSDKVAQLIDRPAVELGFWDPSVNQQLRVAGRAQLLTDAEAVDSAWAALRPEARLIYQSAAAPGTPIDPTAPAPPDADRRDVFSVINIRWERWDWLWLGPDGHRRARIHWSRDGERQAVWVVP
ncbi:pyridoxamine 5'-phosphate oxidase family protein [Thalassobaculum sp.]|uniref:pyridoxamine 5'-phosphate oxidase family protein n=1 Tax=Thalassobaculum sp. TaxID=2022740 RepID=UPI0032F0928D